MTESIAHIVFRCDASSSMGIGHVIRCFSLANYLVKIKIKITFVVSAETVEIIDFFMNNSFNITHVWPKEKIDWIIFDGYQFNITEESKHRNQAKKIMVIDDLANRPHDCDVLIDQTFGRKPDEYKDYVPKECHILTGSNYALLRPEFSSLREKAMEKRREIKPVEQLLVSIGGTDPHNVTLTILCALENIKLPLIVDVILHPNSSFKEEIEEQIKQSPHTVHLHMSVENMADMMMQADLAIGAAGTTSWERCCLGLPTLMIEVADNQKFIAAGLDKAGAAVNLGRYDKVRAKDISDKITYFIEHLDALMDMSTKAMTIVDGKGVERILPYLIGATEKNVGLRLMDDADMQVLFDWQNHPKTREHARNPEVPSWEEHKKWFLQALNNSKRQLYMITQEQSSLGMIRLDRRDDGESSYEVSILIAPDFYGKGFGKEALKLIRHLQPQAILWAEILPENKASQALFERLDYKRVKETWYRQDPNDNI